MFSTFVPIRCGAGVQDREPQHIRDHNPHNTHLQQPQPARWSSHPTPALRASQRPRGWAREMQRWPRGTPRTTSKGGARAKEDQGRERLFTLGCALPDPRLGKRAVLCHHHSKTRENLQVEKSFSQLLALIIFLKYKSTCCGSSLESFTTNSLWTNSFGGLFVYR